MVVHLLGNPARLASLQRLSSSEDLIICLDSGVCCQLDHAFYEAEACAAYQLPRPQQLSMADIALQCASADKVISWY